MGNYIDKEKLEDRLSVAVVRRIYDDNNDGSADTGPLLQVIVDAERRFESFMIGIYPTLAELRTNGGEAASSIVLDLAEALAVKRFPRAANREWLPLLEDATKQMKEYRTGLQKIPVQGSPNPPANTGGRVELYGPEVVATDNDSVFTGGFGVF